MLLVALVCASEFALSDLTRGAHFVNIVLPPGLDDDLVAVCERVHIMGISSNRASSALLM